MMTHAWQPIGLAAAILLLGGCATLPAPGDPALAVAPSLRLMKDMTRDLSSDAFAGRAPSTEGEARVTDYIVSQFKAAGLQPGANGGWLQPVPTVEMRAQAVTPLTVTAGGRTQSFRFGEDFVTGSYRFVPRTDVRDSEIVFVGYGINAPELGWNDYAGVDMRGKTALILINDPDYAMDGEDGAFKGRRMTYYGRWIYKFEEAARQGATAALIVHDSYPAAYGWNVVNSGWTGAQYFVASANDGADQTAANGWVQKPVAEAILGAAGKDLAALTRAAQTRGFKAMPLGVSASWGFDSAIRRSLSHNVVGILPGTKRPDEYVLYSAHWDHIGRCTPDAGGDDICNGAIDNALGTAAITAIADASSRAGGTERSQVFLAWTLEESGLLGSKYYAQNPLYPLAQTVGGVNLDAPLPGSAARGYTLIGGDKSDLGAVYRQALGEFGLADYPEATPERGYYYRSDHFSLAKLGVPMFYLDRSEDWIAGGVEAGKAASEAYNSTLYHTPNDEWSDTWDWSGIAQDLAFHYRLGQLLANSRAWPNWHAGDEFRASRDASCRAAAAGCGR